MSISRQHFDALNAMGITLWQQKAPYIAEEAAPSTDVQSISHPKSASKPQYLAIDFPTLEKVPLFLDILISLDLSLGEIKTTETTIDLGFINWHFHDMETGEKAQDETSITLIDGNLTTPTIEQIAESPVLKKALWAHIAEYGANL